MIDSAPRPADAVILNDPSNLAGGLSSALVADVKLALDVWVTHLSGLGTLTVQVNVANDGLNGTLADGAPTLDTVIGTEDGHTLIQSGAVHELSTGTHLGGGASDISIDVNAAYLGQMYLGSGNAPAGLYDGLSLFEHEITHGLGFGGETSPTGVLDATYETAWDHDLASIGGTEVFTGANATAANGGALVNITTVAGGEGYAHLSNVASDPNAGDLMTGLGLPTGVRRVISNVDLGILADVGVPVTGMAGAITVGGPAVATAVAGASSSIGGLTLADTGAFTSSTLTLSVTDTAGTLSATRAGGGTVAAASSGHALTLTGSLADVRTELASLRYAAQAAGTDAVQVFVVDSFGNTGGASLAVVTPGAVAVPAGVAVPSPRVLSLAATAGAAGPLGAGRPVQFVLGLSAPVTVGAAGSVGLALSDGGVALYSAAGSTPTSLVFATTVAAGQAAPNLTVTGLILAGGATLAGADGSAVTLAVDATTPGAATGLVVDTRPPAAPGLALAAASDSGLVGDGITDAAYQVLTGTAEAGSTVTLREGTTLLGTATASATGGWSWTAGLGAGRHAVTATATDAAGNVSAPSATLALVIDTVAPGAPTLALASAAGAAAPVFSGTAEAGSTVTLLEGTAVVGTAVAASNGAWSATLGAPLALGTTVLAATATDAAGNVSALSQSLSFADGGTGAAAGLSSVTIPASPAAAGPALVTLGDAGQTQSFAAAPGASIVVVGGGAASIAASTDAAGAMTVFGNGGTISFVNGGGTAIVVGNGSTSLALQGGLSTSTLVAFVGDADTRYVGGTGADEILGGDGSLDLAGGTGGTLLVFGGTGALSLTAGMETDMIIGGAGVETIHAGVGAVFAGTGGSVLSASGAGTFLAGNVSGDRLSASATGGDILVAGAGNETLAGAGAAYADLIFGGSGAASVSLGHGADTFAAGSGGGLVQLGTGNATLYLGTGAATTVSAASGSAGGTDFISGFRVGTDHLALGGYAKPATLTASGSGTTLGLVDGTHIVLSGVSVSSAASLFA